MNCWLVGYTLSGEIAPSRDTEAVFDRGGAVAHATSGRRGLDMPVDADSALPYRVRGPPNLTWPDDWHVPSNEAEAHKDERGRKIATAVKLLDDM